MRIVASILFGAAVVAASLQPAAAQTKSADDIIKLLKPTNTVGSGTRGIRPANPTPDAAASPAPMTAAPAMAPAAAHTAPAAPAIKTAAAAAPRPAMVPPPSANLEVQFASDSADLTPKAREALDQLGRALSSNELAGYRFRIEGHTDTVGSPDHNRSLSARRADAVVSYLADTYHVDRARMQPVGLGQDQLAVPTGPGVDEPRNRRVQVVNLGA